MPAPMPQSQQAPNAAPGPSQDAAPAPQPSMTQQPSPGISPSALMKYEILDSNNDKSTVDEQYIMQSLNKLGANIQGVSPDGLHFQIVDPKTGEGYQAKVDQVMKQGLGWHMTGVSPQNADYSNVSPQWRAMVHTLPDDASKKAFLTQQLENMGHQSPQIVGQGRDWYAYSPDHNQWVGLTNSPEWGLPDVAEGAILGGRALSNSAGAVLGTLAGGGVGAIPGFAAGGAAYDTALRGAMAYANPDYRKIASSDLGNMALDTGVNAAIDAGTMGLGRFIPKSGLAGAASAPLSSIAKATGSVAEELGGGIAKAGKFLGSEVPSEIAGGFATPHYSAIGGGMQLPRDLLTGGAKAMGWVGEKMGETELPQALKGGMAEEGYNGAKNWLTEHSQDLLKPRVPAETATENLARQMSGEAAKPYQPTARDVMTNLTDKLRGRVQGPTLGSGEPGLSTAADYLNKGAGVADRAYDFGRAMQAPVTAATQAAFKTAGGVGRAIGGAGTAAKNLGTLGKPLELPAMSSALYQAKGKNAVEQAMYDYLRRKPSALKGPELFSYPQSSGSPEEAH